MSGLLNRNLLNLEEKKLRYNKIYTIDLRNFEVVLKDTKIDIF